MAVIRARSKHHLPEGVVLDLNREPNEEYWRQVLLKTLENERENAEYTGGEGAGDDGQMSDYNENIIEPASGNTGMNDTFDELGLNTSAGGEM